jgi:hypothetical protein
VLPLQSKSWAFFVSLPLSLLQLIVFVFPADAGPAVRAVTPAIGTSAAEAATAPIMIRFLSTLVFSFI